MNSSYFSWSLCLNFKTWNKVGLLSSEINNWLKFNVNFKINKIKETPYKIKAALVISSRRTSFPLSHTSFPSL